jgi:hypothetical protein
MPIRPGLPPLGNRGVHTRPPFGVGAAIVGFGRNGDAQVRRSSSQATGGEVCGHRPMLFHRNIFEQRYGAAAPSPTAAHRTKELDVTHLLPHNKFADPIQIRAFREANSGE